MTMRAHFASLVLNEMSVNPDIWVVTGDLGYKVWDDVRTQFPERFLNVGAAEQAMIGVSVGLALKGKIPLAFSITPFLLYRPFETIRNYIHHEKIPVKLIASGRAMEYHTNGISHWATEDKAVMHIFSSISAHWPETNEDVSAIFKRVIDEPIPFYVNLKR